MEADNTYYIAANALRKIIRRARLRATTAVLAAAAHRGPKTISAMMRVRNEQEYIGSSVRSILPIVDEVVIVDNMSTDETPSIIRDLEWEFPGRVRSAVYVHRLARYGEENQRLGSTPGGLRSPSLLANFYNYCLELCRHPFILKWDGDTIALPEMERAISQFRRNGKQTLWHIGANLHESRTRLIASRPFEEIEPRLFYRRFAYYDNALGYCETLQSPYLREEGRYFDWRYPDPLYVHMKFCKTDRFSNMSEDLQVRERLASDVGEAASQAVIEAVERWKL